MTTGMRLVKPWLILGLGTNWIQMHLPGAEATQSWCRSHNFLNQKPWHPLNFRNQMKVFEAQEQAEKDAKAKAEGKVRPRPLRS